MIAVLLVCLAPACAIGAAALFAELSERSDER